MRRNQKKEVDEARRKMEMGENEASRARRKREVGQGGR